MATRPGRQGGALVAQHPGRATRELPIGVALDLHATLTERLVTSADGRSSVSQTYPHPACTATASGSAGSFSRSFRRQGRGGDGLGGGNRPMNRTHAPGYRPRRRCAIWSMRRATWMGCRRAREPALVGGFPHATSRCGPFPGVVVTDADMRPGPSAARGDLSSSLGGAGGLRLHGREPLDQVGLRGPRLWRTAPVLLLRPCGQLRVGGTQGRDDR